MMSMRYIALRFSPFWFDVDAAAIITLMLPAMPCFSLLRHFSQRCLYALLLSFFMLHVMPPAAARCCRHAMPLLLMIDII